MKRCIRVVKGNIAWNRGRIGKPFNRAKPSLRKSQRRTKQLKRQEWNRELRQKYGLRNKAMLTSLLYERMVMHAEKLARELSVEMPNIKAAYPSPWPELNERVKRKLEAMR